MTMDEEGAGARLKNVLEDSYKTVEEIRAFLVSVYQDNETPDLGKLPNLEKKLVLENFQIKKESDAYQKKLRDLHETQIFKKTASVNKNLYQDKTRVKLQEIIRDLNLFSNRWMELLGEIPELKTEAIQDISNYDKLDLEAQYTKDAILRKLSDLESVIDVSSHEVEFNKELSQLKELIQHEKLQRFKLYILNKSLYSNRIKKLKDLDNKWGSRLDELIKMEESIQKFKTKLDKISKDETEILEDDLVLLGLQDYDEQSDEEEQQEDEQEEEPELAEEHIEEEQEEEPELEEELLEEQGENEQVGEESDVNEIEAEEPEQEKPEQDLIQEVVQDTKEDTMPGTEVETQETNGEESSKRQIEEEEEGESKRFKSEEIPDQDMDIDLELAQ